MNGGEAGGKEGPKNPGFKKGSVFQGVTGDPEAYCKYLVEGEISRDLNDFPLAYASDAFHWQSLLNIKGN